MDLNIAKKNEMVNHSVTISKNNRMSQSDSQRGIHQDI